MLWGKLIVYEVYSGEEREKQKRNIVKPWDYVSQQLWIWEGPGCRGHPTSLILPPHLAQTPLPPWASAARGLSPEPPHHLPQLETNWMSTERLSWPTTRSVMILRTAYCQGLAIITQGPNPACHSFREVLLNTAKPPCLSITYGCHKRGETNHTACLRYLLSAFHRNSLPISARDQELTRERPEKADVNKNNSATWRLKGIVFFHLSCTYCLSSMNTFLW